MNDERDWAEIRPQASSGMGEAGMGALRITLLFGSAAIALALFVAPLLDRNGSTRFASSSFRGLDRTATGTARASQGYSQYTIRRSVLQTSPGAMCIIHSNGARSGDC
jgi:hypothetical protein